MSLNINNILEQMLEAAASSFGRDWSKVGDLAKVEFKVILKRIEEIGKSVLDPNSTISLRMAKHLIKAQIQLVVQVFVGLTVMTVVAVQKAINSALKVVKSTINAGIGIVLL